MFVLAAIGCWELFRRLPAGRGTLLAACALAAVLALRVQETGSAGVFRLWQSGAQFTSAGEYVRSKLPSNALILSVLHSGSARYYSGRLTMRWDLLGPEWWPRALDVVTGLGYRPYLLVSSVEEVDIRRHFGWDSDEEAPGTIVAELPGPLGVVLYDPLREHKAPKAIMPLVVSCPCAFGDQGFGGDLEGDYRSARFRDP
jgi:hypothetical protein